MRNLEREIAKICRKQVKRLSLKNNVEEAHPKVTESALEEYSGVRKFRYGEALDQNRVGQVTGLAWDTGRRRVADHRGSGGPCKGRHVRTGSLGDVMQESD